LAREGEGGSDRRLGIDLGPELIEHRAPFDPDRGDRRCPELVGSSGNCEVFIQQAIPAPPIMGVEQTQAQLREERKFAR